MQGYFQVSYFHMPKEDIAPLGTEAEEPKTLKVQYTIISRRSKERAGLRYQRRGIDENSQVANFVETETITQVKVLSYS
jgi:hypothetical protein